MTEAEREAERRYPQFFNDRDAFVAGTEWQAKQDGVRQVIGDRILAGENPIEVAHDYDIPLTITDDMVGRGYQQLMNPKRGDHPVATFRAALKAALEVPGD